MGMPFSVFAREHILTWDHVLNPYTINRELELKPEQKTRAIIYTVMSAGIAAGATLVLNRSRTTLLLIAGGTALVTFYAVTGYFKWCLTQPPGDAGRRPPPVSREPRRGERPDPTSPYRPPASSSARTTGFATPGSRHTIEDFRQKPDWLVPQRTAGGGFLDVTTNLRRESERAYFASLWKKIYGDRTDAIAHWANYSEQDDLLRSNKLSVEEGAPWESFARFAQIHLQ